MAITKATASSVAPAAKGDLVVGSATNDAAVLGVGTNDQVLTADSSTATGLKWAAAGGGGSNWSLLNSGGTALTAAQTITVSGISGKDKIMVLFKNASASSASQEIYIRLNTDTSSNYYDFGQQLAFTSSYNVNNFSAWEGDARSYIVTGAMSSGADSRVSGSCLITGCNASGVKIFQSFAGVTQGSGNGATPNLVGGYYDSSSTISSISMFTTGGTFDQGTVYVFTSA